MKRQSHHISVALAFWVLLTAANAIAGDIARFDFLDVGQGDAMLVTSPEGKTMLVDAGGSRHIVDKLRQRGVSVIDLAVISHHHLDHYGGLDDVIRAIDVKNVLVTNSCILREIASLQFWSKTEKVMDTVKNR